MPPVSFEISSAIMSLDFLSASFTAGRAKSGKGAPPVRQETVPRLRTGLVDEWVAYLAPLVMGDAARGVFALPPLSDMANRLPFKLLDSRQIGDDLRLTLRPA